MIHFPYPVCLVVFPPPEHLFPIHHQNMFSLQKRLISLLFYLGPIVLVGRARCENRQVVANCAIIPGNLNFSDMIVGEKKKERGVTFQTVGHIREMSKNRASEILWEIKVGDSTSCVGCTCFRRPWENVPGVKCVARAQVRSFPPPTWTGSVYLTPVSFLHNVIRRWPCFFSFSKTHNLK